MYIDQIGTIRFFFKNFLFPLPDLNFSQLILGGDFNCCLNPLLDCSLSKPCAQSKSSKTIELFMDQYAVSDVWSSFNLSAKQFSFFSPIHQTFSQIDYLFLTTNYFHSSGTVPTILLLFRIMPQLQWISLFLVGQLPGLFAVKFFSYF